MAESLDQSEIDALMDAVAAEQDHEPVEGPPHIYSRRRRDFENVEITDYDFRRPERMSKDQMRALQTLHEAFARSFGASLSGYLRTIVEVRVAHVDQMIFSEFIASLPNPTSFNLVTAEELEGQICLELSPLVVYPMIDRLLGGTNQDLFIPPREMTQIEIQLIGTVLSKAMTALAEAWEGVRTIDFRLGEMESNPQIVQIVPPNEVVVSIGFEIKLCGRAGTMSLCVPYNLIEPVIEDLSAQNWAATGKLQREHQWERVIGDHLGDAKLEVTGILAQTTITLAELQRLDVGDVIVTERSARSPVVLAVAGRPKFLANIGRARGNRALRVIRAVQPADRVQ